MMRLHPIVCKIAIPLPWGFFKRFFHCELGLTPNDWVIQAGGVVAHSHQGLALGTLVNHLHEALSILGLYSLGHPYRERRGGGILEAGNIARKSSKRFTQK